MCAIPSVCEDMGLGGRASLQRQRDGGERGRLVMLEDEGERLDHLAVAALCLDEALAEGAEGGRQRTSASSQRAPSPHLDRPSPWLEASADWPACNVGDAASVANVFSKVHANRGDIETLIYNAGVGAFSDVGASTPEQFDTARRVNAPGCFFRAMRCRRLSLTTGRF